MTASRSVFRRTYDGFAFFAVIQLAAMAGLLTYGYSNGKLDAATLARLSAAWRGDPPSTQPAVSSAQVDKSTVSESSPLPESTGNLSDDLRILRMESDRSKVELQQQFELVNAMLVKIATDREAVAQVQAQSQIKQERPSVEQRANGFRRQVDIFEELSPKVAADHLLAIEDPREAARLLVAMEPRKAKKVVEAAKDGDRLRQMQEVLARVQDVAPDRTEPLESQP